MRVTILGATGGVGTELVRQALQRGHEVNAVVRDPARLSVPGHERLTVHQADVTDAAQIVPAVEGTDAVLSALGPHGLGPTSICEEGALSAIQAMGKAGVSRYLMVGAAGMAIDAEDSLMLRKIGKPLLQRILRNCYADLARAEDEVGSSNLDWTIVRPPRLTKKAGKGSYRTATERNLRGGSISRADVAACMLDLLDDAPSVRRHVSVA